MAFFALFMGMFLCESKLDKPGKTEEREEQQGSGGGAKEELLAQNRSYFDMQNKYETFCVLYTSGDP